MDQNEEVKKLKLRIAQLEKINHSLMIRVEKTISTSGGAFHLFEKNGMLQAEVEKKTSQLQSTIEELKKQDRAINGSLLVSETDLDGKIIYANEKFCEVSGYSKEELIGQNHNIVNSSYHSVQFWNEFWKVLRAGVPYRGEICNKRKNGELYWVDTSIYPNLDRRGVVCGYTSVRLDITEKKLIELTNHHREKLAAIGELAAGVGHEINNPLAISVGTVAMVKKILASGSLDFQKLSKYMDNINIANQRIGTIVNGLRVYSRSDNESLEEVSVRNAITQTLDLIQGIYKTQGIRIILDIREDLDLFVNANMGKLQQILFNLLSNARDATENRESRIIEVGLKELNSSQLMLYVRDNGTGIPKELIHKIVEPYFTTKTAGKGTGIGLGLVRNFIEMFKGQLEIDSVVGVGSTFKIILPISKRQNHIDDDTKEALCVQPLKKAQ